MRSLSCLLLVIWSLLLTACTTDLEGMAEYRLEYARQNKGDIQFVAIQPSNSASFINGVRLAVQEINQRPEKLLGRTLKIQTETEGSTFEATKSSIERIVADPRTVAVIGHRLSSIAVPASVMYERSQIVFLSSFATAQTLTGHGFQYVFRMSPNTSVMAAQLANVATTLGYKRIVVLYARDDLNRELAFLFEDAAISERIKLVKRISFFEKETNYRSIISRFNNENFDAVFIAASAEPTARMIKQLRELGLNQPILGNDSLNNIEFANLISNSAQNIIAPTLYRINDRSVLNQHFIQAYKNSYKTEPDYSAAQGYDSVMLLVSGIERAGSTLPPLLSSTLRYMPAWVGLTGLHAFDATGEMLGKNYFFHVWQQGQWQNIPAIHIPYLVKRFTQYQQKLHPEHTVTDFSQVFAQRMHTDDHRSYLLDLAHEILQFQSIGVIYENTPEGRKASGYDLWQPLAKKKNLNLVGCEIPFSLLGGAEIERALVACYGKLSLNTEALLVPYYKGINTTLIEKLNNSLAFFKIPAISFDEQSTDPNISLLFTKRTDVNLQSMREMQVYSPLLSGLKVHEFAERLKGLPEVTVNLLNLQQFGKPDKPILELSPDTYLYSKPLFIKKEAVAP
ncbi:MAG: ABC transporter substrate-binding protein [Thiofilum sp.]|uniref:ABC transporter substrate-binding protein n=1 Tax=Thiofilum sp. TaxID=2212733 RepID=UPI0025D57EAA|nr:ABC transporter substrate-binding protein [Thiofilum sp.]MBK8452752.1 ABC transporter substrate-binding protein [Thiofilum sp.]